MKRKPFSARYLLFTATALFSASLFAADLVPEHKPGFLTDYERFVHDEIGQNVPGYALAVVLNGEVVLLKGYGVKKFGAEDAIDTNTVFRIASVSKTFASAAAAVLVQKNVLAWDSRVKPYLQTVRFKNKSHASQLRVNHLLSHSSGLVQHAYTNLLNRNVDYGQIKKLLKDVNFVCKPGDCYGYQNVVYSLIGDVIEYVSASKYERFVKDNLFTPLEMQTASFGLDGFTGNKNTAVPHVWRNDRWLPVAVKPNFYSVAPAAGVNASITDMSKWLLAQLGKRPDVLREQLLVEMHTKHIKTTKSQAHYGQWENVDNAYYGLGWRVFDYGGQADFVHHGGWVQGFRTEMVFNPKLDMGMVLLVNAERSYASKAVPAFLDLYIRHALNAPSTVEKISISDKIL